MCVYARLCQMIYYKKEQRPSNQWDNEIIVTKLSGGPDLFHLFQLKLTKHLFDGISKYVINLLTWKIVPGAKIDYFLRCT